MMMRVKLCIFLIICGGYLLSVDAIYGRYCFHYTWTPIVYEDNINVDDKNEYNCTVHKGVPCIKPVLRDNPNTTEIWENKDTEKLCHITSGNACIKYTFKYNNDIVNMSMFCGKATEDTQMPITSGCYEQQVRGYIVEMCACKSGNGIKPCNTSVKVNYSIILVITMFLSIFLNFT